MTGRLDCVIERLRYYGVVTVLQKSIEPASSTPPKSEIDEPAK